MMKNPTTPLRERRTIAEEEVVMDAAAMVMEGEAVVAVEVVSTTDAEGTQCWTAIIVVYEDMWNAIAGSSAAVHSKKTPTKR